MRTLLLCLILLACLPAAELQVVEMADGRSLHAYVHADDRGDERFRKLVLMFKGREMGQQRIRWADVAQVRELTPDEVAEHQPSADVVAEAPAAPAPPAGGDRVARLADLDAQAVQLQSDVEALERARREIVKQARTLRQELLIEWGRSQNWSDIVGVSGVRSSDVATLNGEMSQIRTLLAADDANQGQLAQLIHTLGSNNRFAHVLRAAGRLYQLPEHLRGL